jgi:REP element-mobilizing transposase RayT
LCYLEKIKTRKNTNRIPQHNYSNPGQYFVTICTENRQEILGKIENNRTVLNDIGIMIDFWWHEIFNKYKNASIDKYIIMPNHIHGIINIVGVDLCIDPNHNNKNNDYNNIVPGENIVSPLQNSNIGQIISWFKRMSTNQYIKNVKNNNWPKFNKRFWQRNYHDHIIRNDKSLNKIREYIVNNPTTWDNDENNMNLKNITNQCR